MQVEGTRGTYTLHERLAVGGMSELWLATGGGRRGAVEVKRLLPTLAAEEAFRELLADEARLTARFDFPDVVCTFDAGDDFLVQPHLPGTTARELWTHATQRGERLPLPLVCGLLARFAVALGRVHAAQENGKPLQVIHRHVSPEALQLGFDGRVRLGDFSIARSTLRSSETQPGIVKGSFPYMSPEAIRGLPLDQRSDVFSLAVCVWELLSGQRLFLGNSDFASLEKVRACVVPTLPAPVPAALDAAVRAALAKDPEARTPSAEALGHALSPFAHGATPEALGAFLRATFPDAHAASQARLQKFVGGLAGLDALIRGTPHRGNNG